jgi:predicted ATP-grasp superfamily ATP-dependent carboligase
MKTSDENSKVVSVGNDEFAEEGVPSKAMVVGASCRAAAQAVYRAGVRWIEAQDEFLDADLLEVAQATALSPNRVLFEEGSQDRYRGVPLLLCGGMENRPEDLARYLELGMVCGVNTEQLRMLRNPANWEKWSEGAGIGWPRSIGVNAAIAIEQVIPQERKWLLKSRSSAGGLGVRVHRSASSLEQELRQGGLQEGEYLQEWIEGINIGATFCSDEHGVRLMGVARSLVAAEYPGPLPFIYRGNIAPWVVSEGVRERLLKFARLVTEGSGVRGLWQADFVLQEGGSKEELLWLLEINPRWSASMELHDFVEREGSEVGTLVRSHLRALFGDVEVRVGGRERVGGRDREAGVMYGKGIVYAPEDLELREEVQLRLWEMRWDGVSVIADSARFSLADIPSPPREIKEDGSQVIGGLEGLKIERGMPIVSVLVAGDGEEVVLERLREGRRAVLELFGASPKLAADQWEPLT